MPRGTGAEPGARGWVYVTAWAYDGQVMATDLGYLPRLQSREEYVDHLEGFTLPTVDELKEGKLSRKLIKSYMLETARHDHDVPELASVFPDRVRLHRLDDTLYRVEDASHAGKVVGLLESLQDRHPVFYTTMAADESNKWVRQVVDQNPWLDRLWLSSPILFELWQYVKRNTPDHRYVRLGFEHEAWYETSTDYHDSDSNADHEDSDSSDDEDTALGLIERRRSKVALTERLGILQEKLQQLIDLYDPLHSLVQLQIPSGGHGGHVFYHDGRSTNRSDSFVEHRATIELVLKLYRTVTENAESHLWVDTTEVGENGFIINGAPVTIRFREPLSEATFNRFIDLGLQRRTSRFRIGGYATRRGPTKVHLAAIDRHLWQPFLMEATSNQLLGVLPSGTCGNTIHRLVTNVQRYLSPNIDVWLGNQLYTETVADSMAEAA